MENLQLIRNSFFGSVAYYCELSAWFTMSTMNTCMHESYFIYESPSKFLPHQVPTVRYWLTVPITGNGGLGFDSGEVA